MMNMIHGAAMRGTRWRKSEHESVSMVFAVVYAGQYLNLAAAIFQTFVQLALSDMTCADCFGMNNRRR